MKTSKVFWNNETLVDLSNRFKNDPSAPAFTPNDVDTSTQPENWPDAEEPALMDVASALRDSASFADESRSRLIVAFATPSNAVIPNDI